MVGRETLIISSAVLKIHFRVFWSETVRFSYQAVRQLVKMHSISSLQKVLWMAGRGLLLSSSTVNEDANFWAFLKG